MSRPRLLTDPEEIAASDEFKRRLKASKKTQEQVAAEIGEGVSQGTIWQWANRRLAIPFQRARHAAKAVGARPEAISAEFRKLVQPDDPFFEGLGGPRTAPSSRAPAGPTYEMVAQPDQSHRVGISLATVADAMMVIRAFLEDQGESVDHLPDPVLVKAALDLVIERAEPLTLANVIAFKRQLATRLEDTDYGNQRREAAGTG